MQYDYLDFNFNDLPEIFDHTIEGNQYQFRLYYNALDDSFHIDIWDDNNVPIVMGEKLVYGEPLWNSINDPRLPLIDIRPLDDSGHETTVSAGNFPSIIKLEFCTDDPFNQNDNNDDTDYEPSDSDENDSDQFTQPSQMTGNDYGNDPTIGGDN